VNGTLNIDVTSYDEQTNGNNVMYSKPTTCFVVKPNAAIIVWSVGSVRSVVTLINTTIVSPSTITIYKNIIKTMLYIYIYIYIYGDRPVYRQDDDDEDAFLGAWRATQVFTAAHDQTLAGQVFGTSKELGGEPVTTETTWEEAVAKGMRAVMRRQDPRRVWHWRWNVAQSHGSENGPDKVLLEELDQELEKDRERRMHTTFAAEAPPEGIQFDVPPSEKHLYPQDLRVALRRLHCNAGHPANSDLKRCLRVAKGSVLAQKLCDYMRCSTCQALQRPKTPRPGKVPAEGLQFNETVQLDLFYLVDATGQKQWFMAIVDVATDYVVARWIRSHESAVLWEAWCNAWVGWAGPPDVAVSDNERGLISAEWVEKTSQSGTHVWPTAAYAPWQKGRIERRISALKDTMRAVMMHRALSGAEAMQVCAQEACHAYNQRPGGCGFSPAQRLFGTRPRAYADLYHNGESAGYHPEAVDTGSSIAQRLVIRRLSQEVAERKSHEEMMAKAAAARGRVLRRSRWANEFTSSESSRRRKSASTRRMRPSGGDFSGRRSWWRCTGPPPSGCSSEGRFSWLPSNMSVDLVPRRRR